MTKVYNDIITLNSSRTVYNIREEGPKDWTCFIANEQFNYLLEKTVKSVFNNDPENHKPIWIAGTYGSGKSHAGAVIKHLLCDPLDDISGYIHTEYGEPKYDALRTNLLTLREKKRLFPVSLYGQQSITHVSDLSLQLQREIKTALVAAHIDIDVKTDYDNYVSHIDENPAFWESLISGCPKLASVAPDVKKLRSELLACEKGVLDIVIEALREKRFDIVLQSENIARWIVEVQNKLREKQVADGLLILWDEFTSVCTSSIGVKILDELQQISEVMMTKENDSYFFFISHPSALNLLSEDKRTQTISRYHFITYNMEPVSAFKIMSRKFNIIDDEAHKMLVDSFYGAHHELLEIFSSSSNQQAETKKDLRKLYPLHPSTANLATYYAREAGSSSRSVFEFLASDQVRAFFNDEQAYSERTSITADYLWDYVLDVFNEDSHKYGAVTERYNTYHLRVEHQGASYVAIFKGILLLNALNNIAHHETVTPNIVNIKNLFVGTSYENELEDVLDFLNEKSIIQRLPGDIYSIQFTALPGDEIEKFKLELLNGDFKYTESVMKFADLAKIEFSKSWSNIARPFFIEFFSQQVNDYTLTSKIENTKRSSSKEYGLFIAILVAKNYDEYNYLINYAQCLNSSKKIANSIILVFDAFMEQLNYDRFIEYMANAKCAGAHNLMSQQETHTNNAKKLIREWVYRIKSSNFNYYFNGIEDSASGSRLNSVINENVAPKIFTSGPETLSLIRIKFSKTYWQKTATKKAVENMLLYNTKGEILEKLPGQGKHVEYLLQDSVDDNLIMKSDIDPKHPLKLVCDYIDNVFKHTNKNQEFNLADKLEPLSKPPFGLYQSYASMSMVAYAMRKYVNQIFDTSGKPREARHIADDVVELFKVFEDGKRSNKLNMMFESKESSDLCKRLISIFKLKQVSGYKDVSSLTDARWALLAYANSKKYPLWSLKYSGCSEVLAGLIDNITVICDPKGLSNQALINSTSKLIKDNEIDMCMLLNRDNVFQNGFISFLKSLDVVNIQDHEQEEVYFYLTQHLQSEIGRWSESEVSTQARNWRIDKSSSSGSTGQGGNHGGVNPSPTINDNPSSNGPSSGSSAITAEALQQFRQESLSKIQDVSVEALKDAIIRLINSEEEFIIKTLMKYVR